MKTIIYIYIYISTNKYKRSYRKVVVDNRNNVKLMKGTLNTCKKEKKVRHHVFTSKVREY